MRPGISEVRDGCELNGNQVKGDLKNAVLGLIFAHHLDAVCPADA